jgi:prepilin-type N-terminal cleavage/methylation domain-containing protein
MNRESQCNKPLSPWKYHWNHKGFTLAEMAIVVLLGSIMLTMGVKMFTAIKDHSAYSDTRSKQETIKTALIGYLRNNKRLPPADTALPPDGTMDAGGWGVLPYRDLGLPRDAVLDGWGNYFSYRVSNTGSGTNWTSVTGFDLASYTETTYTAITVNDVSSPPPLTAQAVVVVISHGKNGFGAATTKGTSRMAPTGGVATEDTNAATGATYNLLDPNPQAGYDDVVLYMTPADLWRPLIDEGTLKACYAYCRSTSSSALEATCTPSGTFNCTASGTPTCSAAGATPTCSPGAPHCTLGGTPICAASTSTAPAGPGCPTVFTIPIGANPVTCP